MDAAPLIDEELAAFLQSGIAMHAASVGPGNVSHLARAAGCRITPDRRSVTLYLVQAEASELIEQVRAHGAIAVVFTKPTSHRTVQLKATDARVIAPRPEDLADIDRQVGAFDAELAAIGFPQRFGWVLAGGSPAGLAAIAFTPSSAFLQTPGPSAGAALRCR